MHRAILFALAAFLCVPAHAEDAAAPAWAFETSDVPVDPAFTFGALPNGMRYVLRENHTPDGTVLVRLRIGSGSLAETDDEERFCLERFGVRPLQYMDDLGWLGDDVWLAHCVHLNADECARMGATGTGVARTTSGARCLVHV